MNSMRVSNEWANRPSDQRFLTVDDLYAKVLGRKAECREESVALDVMKLVPLENGELALTDGKAIGAQLTNWSFGQLCQRAKAPAGYLRTLPAELAAIPLQWSLERHETTEDEGNDAKLLIRRNGHVSISAVTSTTYGRIWDADVVRAVRDNVDMSEWKVPAATYSATDPKRATTLYASDRDVFMFLVNEASVEIGGECIKRGFYVWNSEVGSASFGIATFTYDYVCDNRIIWGQSNFRELVIRHTAGGPHRFMARAVPQLETYAQSSTLEMANTIRAAKAKEVAKDRKGVQDWLRARGFTTKVAGAAYDAAEKDPRNYNPRSVWGLVQGLTDAAHDIEHVDERTTMEARAGALLETL